MSTESTETQHVAVTAQGDTPSPADDSARRAAETLAELTKLLGEAKTAATEAAENRRLTAAALTEVQAKLAETNTVATAAAAAGAQIAADAAVVATHSANIGEAQAHAAKVRGELDKTATQATQSATTAEGLQTRTQAAADASAALLVEVQASKAATDASATAVNETLDQSKQSAAQTKALADKSKTVEEVIAAYEAKLKLIQAEAEQKLKTVEQLLPGATSAGLAHEFNTRAASFKTPRVRWQFIFIGSLVLLILLGVTGLVHVIQTGSALTYDELLRLWLSRVPVAGALLWLALHASRESALARRLEEDYGYKSAIASSFEGFHKQMKDLGNAAESNGPLKQLCENTLATIATPPGRIYERHELTVSPSAEAVALANTLLSLAKATKPV